MHIILWESVIIYVTYREKYSPNLNSIYICELWKKTEKKNHYLKLLNSFKHVRIIICCVK